MYILHLLRWSCVLFFFLLLTKWITFLTCIDAQVTDFQFVIFSNLCYTLFLDLSVCIYTNVFIFLSPNLSSYLATILFVVPPCFWLSMYVFPIFFLFFLIFCIYKSFKVAWNLNTIIPFKNIFTVEIFKCLSVFLVFKLITLSSHSK